jgi:hypothetical protein
MSIHRIINNFRFVVQCAACLTKQEIQTTTYAGTGHHAALALAERDWLVFDIDGPRYHKHEVTVCPRCSEAVYWLRRYAMKPLPKSTEASIVQTETA